jgi:hypothetical protein
MASDIPKAVPAGDAGIMLAPRQSLQQTMPRQTFEEPPTYFREVIRLRKGESS